MYRLIFIVLAIIAVLSAIFLFPKLNKPKEAPLPFSLKLPNGWYRDLGVKGNEKLLSFSPDKNNKGITYRAIISAGVTPSKLDLSGEVIKARREIGNLSVNHKFLNDKSITIKNQPAHLFEYNTLLQDDSQNVEKILGKSGLLIRHTDIITVKDGYFIDIAAYAYEWAMPEFIDVIEKSLNSLSFK